MISPKLIEMLDRLRDPAPIDWRNHTAIGALADVVVASGAMNAAFGYQIFPAPKPHGVLDWHPDDP